MINTSDIETISQASLTFITGSCTHGVEDDWLGDVGTVDLAVGVAHALVQSLQGEVGGVIWLLQKYVACEEKIELHHKSRNIFARQEVNLFN